MDELDAEGLARLCQAVYRLRRARQKYMAAASDLFADPIWDMMLDLYVASHGHDEKALADEPQHRFAHRRRAGLITLDKMRDPHAAWR